MSESVSTPLFRPDQVFVEPQVKDLPHTQEILARLGPVEIESVDDPRAIKVTQDISGAKKALLLTRLKVDPLKEFTAMTESTGRPTYSLNLISNCHLECTYCILQSYLANNPILTLYTNLEEIFEKLTDQLERIPLGSVVGTGQLADSLALEELTHFHRQLIPFFGKQDRVQLELKTKSDAVTPLLSLDHEGQTVVSWSLAPERVQKGEEYKTAPIPQRIEAMVACQQAGYPIGLHLDPVIHHTSWEKNYQRMIDQVFASIQAKDVAWASIGTLRFPVRQVQTMRNRFPNNRKIFHNLASTHQRFMHYPDRLRESIYQRIRQYLEKHLPEDKIYISMEAEQTDQEEVV